ncbi:MAG TPA: sigma-70 family RNA polymerase sigma factor [bacterium]|nr:sigma-70 family RNA polymerase sigma factor [bacterium]
MDNDQAKILIAAIMQGDAAAEKMFFKGYWHEVEFLIKLRIGRANPDLQDLCQMVFIDLFKRIRAGEYDSSKGSPGAFVQSTIKFKILDYLKSRHYQERKNHAAFNERSAANPEESADHLLIHEEDKNTIERALHALPEPYQTILIFYYYHQLKIKEIADKLGMPEQKVSNYKSYALTLLAREMRKARGAREKSE